MCKLARLRFSNACSFSPYCEKSTLKSIGNMANSDGLTHIHVLRCQYQACLCISESCCWARRPCFRGAKTFFFSRRLKKFNWWWEASGVTKPVGCFRLFRPFVEAESQSTSYLVRGEIEFHLYAGEALKQGLNVLNVLVLQWVWQDVCSSYDRERGALTGARQ